MHAPGSQYQSTRSIFHDDYVTVGYIRVDNQGNFVAPNVHYLQTGIQCTGIVWGDCQADSQQITFDNPYPAGKDVSLFAGAYMTVMHVEERPETDQYNEWSVWLYSVASAY